MPITTTAMIGAVVGYLAKKLKENQSINDFFADFTDTSVKWVRPVLLTDDAKPKELLEDLQADPADSLNWAAIETALAKVLKKNPQAEQSLQKMYETILSKTKTKTDPATASIVNSKNIVQNSTIHAGGTVHIGDSTTTNQTHSGSGDNVAGNKINTTQIGNNSHDNIVLQGLTSDKEINININTTDKNAHLKQIQSKKDTHIGILLYIKNNVSVEREVRNIQSGIATDLRIDEYFQNSPDYQKLLQRIDYQRNKVLELVKMGNTLYLKESEKLAIFERNEKEFRTNALRLAETFLRIEPRTERLQKARALFEQGLILDADKILVEMDLMKDQDALIAQMDYLQARKIQLLDLPKM